MDTPQQKSYKVLLIGDSCIDRFHYGECNRLSPEAPVPVLVHTKTIETGGMALNVKNNLLAFQQHIQVKLLTNKEKIIKERFIDAKTGQHIMRFDVGDSQKVNSLSISKIKDFLDYDLIVISDYEKGFITPDIAEKICKAAANKNIPVFVDTKKKKIDCFKNAFIKINEKEYNSLESGFSAEHTIVTLGPRGAKWKDSMFSTKPVQVSDVSGAGDTFLSVLAIAYIANNKNMELAIRKAIKASTYVVQKSGTYPITGEDIEKLCI